MNTVELFSGTGSFSKVAYQLGYDIFRVEKFNHLGFKAELFKDILDVKRSDLPKKIDILWASPPCTCFSVASIGSSWCGNYCPKRVKTALGMAYVLKTIELINEIKKDNPNLIWFIENPRGVLRKMAFIENIGIRHTITYCQYGDTRMKPTDIWTNFKEWISRPACKNGDKCHIPAPRGSKTGTQGLKGNMERSVIPPELFYEIFENIKR